MKNSYLIILALICCSCMKTVHTTINSNMYNAYAFKQGTYWIYQDTVNGERDSFVVTNSNLNFTNEPSNSKTEIDLYDEYRYNIDIYNIGAIAGSFLDSIKGSIEIFLNVNSYNIYMYNNKIQFPNYSYGYQLFTYPFLSGLKDQSYINLYDSSSFDTISVSNVLNQYVLNGIKYTKIVQIHHYENLDSIQYTTFNNIKNWQHCFIHNDLFYLSDNIGLVKIIINHPTDSIFHNWELLSYHIVK